MAVSRTPLEHIPEAILARAIEKSVSEKLGTLTREMGEFTKGMSGEDAGRARFLLLALTEQAAESFFSKMRERLNKKESSE